MKRKLVSLALVAAIGLSTVPGVQARDGISPGGAAALGVLGGLAIGGAIASSQNQYAPGQRIYRAPRPVYVEEYGPECHMERRRYVDAYGDVIIRRVEVCE
jgi:hypothetical protein